MEFGRTSIHTHTYNPAYITLIVIFIQMTGYFIKQKKDIYKYTDYYIIYDLCKRKNVDVHSCCVFALKKVFIFSCFSLEFLPKSTFHTDGTEGANMPDQEWCNCETEEIL